MTNIKTFEDACAALGIDPKALPDLTMLPEQDAKAILAYYKLSIIARALNQEANDGKPWTPDWTNGKWDKYYPWFNMSSGSGLRFVGYVDRNSYSYVGSRLCYISLVVAKYAGQQFIDLYTDLFTT